MSKHNTDGPPCAHMEQLLQDAANNSSTGIRRWYAVAHAARCHRCGTFLQRMKMMVEALQKSKPDVSEDSLARLQAKLKSLK